VGSRGWRRCGGRADSEVECWALDRRTVGTRLGDLESQFGDGAVQALIQRESEVELLIGGFFRIDFDLADMQLVRIDDADFAARKKTTVDNSFYCPRLAQRRGQSLS